MCRLLRSLAVEMPGTPNAIRKPEIHPPAIRNGLQSVIFLAVTALLIARPQRAFVAQVFAQRVTMSRSRAWRASSWLTVKNIMVNALKI
jgi:hypothetical protein